MKRPSLILLLAPTLFFTSCKEPEKNTLRGETVRELTEADLVNVTKFAQQLTADAEAGNASRIAKAFNVRGFFVRALDGIEMSDEQFEPFMQDVIRGTNNRRGGLGWGLLEQKITFLKLHQFKGMKMPLFRVDADGGFDYLYMMTMPNKAGQMKVYDTFVLSNGEWASMTTRRMILPSVKQMLGSKFSRAFKKNSETDFTENIDTIKRFTSSLQTGDVATVQSTYRSLPKSLQTQRFFWSNYLGSLIDEPETHLKEAEKFEAAFPDDAGVAAMMLDADANREDWDGVRQRLDVIREFVGGDHYLDNFEAGIYAYQEDFKNALKLGKKARAASPETEDYWWTLFTSLGGLDQHAEMASTLKAYQKQFEVALTKEDFADGFLDKFLASPEGKAHFGE